MCDSCNQQNNIPEFPIECPVYLTSTCITYVGATLPNTNILNNDTLTTVLQKIDSVISGGGGDQDFQSVLDIGKTGSFNSGKQQVYFFDGDLIGGIYSEKADGTGFTDFQVSSTYVSLYNTVNSGAIFGNIEINGGHVHISEATNSGSTSVSFQTPNSGVTTGLRFPSYTVTGTYTLATTEDIPTTKVFKGLISQTGTNAPTLITLKNTTGLTFTPQYIGVASYSLIPSVNLEIVKTFLNILPYGGAPGDYVAGISITDSGDGTGLIQIYTTFGGLPFNDLLQFSPISIEMY
jgi:hypothetical protein